MNPRALCLLTVLSTAASAGDGVYRWVDARGEVHYTNDLDSLPGDVVLTPVEGGELGVITSEPAPRSKANAPPSLAAAPAPEHLEVARVEAETRRANAEARRAELEIQRTQRDEEDYWRGSFREARRRILLVQDSLQRERAQLELGGMPVTMRISQPYGHSGCHGGNHVCGSVDEFEKTRLTVQELERDLKEAEDQLRDLERRASHQSIPLEWRR